MNAEVLIIGGGLAGAAAAIRLAGAGRRVVLLEKEALPQHKVCGEFLSPEALTYLGSLGVDVHALGAVPIRSVRFAGRQSFTSARLPFAAMSVTRRHLDEALLQRAQQTGADVQRGRRVTSLQCDSGVWTASFGDEHPVTAPTAFLCTGKHDLHGHPRPPGRQTDLVAFKMYWRLSPEQTATLHDHVDLILFRGGYVGFQLVEHGMANLCCLVQRRELKRIGGRWDALLGAMRSDSALLRERLQGAEPLLAAPLAVAAIPYGYVRTSAASTASPNLWALGDQAAVIPSFTGDGMSIALHSGCLAAEMYLRGDSSEAFHTILHDQLASQVALATMISRGLVHAPVRALLRSIATTWPGVLRVVASRTRIPARALLPLTSRTPTVKADVRDAAHSI